MTKPLSLAAQAVRKAYYNTDDDLAGSALAAALRVAAEQVGNWDAAEHLLSIAAELEGHG